MPRAQAAFSIQAASSTPRRPGEKLRAHAQGSRAASQMKARKMDGPPQASLLCGNIKLRHLLWKEAPVCPVRKLSGPSVCSQGQLMGWALAASQGTQNAPSQYSESIWAGCPSTAGLCGTVPLPFGRPRAITVHSDAPCGGKKAGSVVFLLSPLLCPPTRGLGCSLPAATCQLYKIFRSPS